MLNQDYNDLEKVMLRDKYKVSLTPIIIIYASCYVYVRLSFQTDEFVPIVDVVWLIIEIVVSFDSKCIHSCSLIFKFWLDCMDGLTASSSSYDMYWMSSSKLNLFMMFGIRGWSLVYCEEEPQKFYECMNSFDMNMVSNKDCFDIGTQNILCAWMKLNTIYFYK